MRPRLAALLATLAIPVVLGLTAITAHAAPCGDADVACLTTQLRAAKAHARAHKAHARAAKAQQAAWIADCIASWDDPAHAADAHDVCVAEAPTLDELRVDPTAAPRR